MQVAAQKVMTTGFRLDFAPLKEPLAFIRCLQWIFAIFAFATTGGYTGQTAASVKCTGKTVADNVTVHFAYPFRLNLVKYEAPLCNNVSGSETLYLSGDFSSSAEFFTTIGVFAFLYCTGVLIIYLGFQQRYRESSRGPVIDLVVTGVFAFMWLVSSSAWAKGLTNVKTSVSPNSIIQAIAVCKGSVVCTAGAVPAMGRLNVSVIFGFLNLILWGGSAWFVYKETPWHKPANPQGSVEEGANQN
ncbi:synaptophysin-like protein 2 [Polyodon spathula]|uniref:synaptophysin-like protein 2 n=1 Tax=Polyodon spathula TaxID=7913 RepID=UPI001B7DD9A9|nr:synaptophysin-like protein 2 [Polyodon spathula]